LGLPWIRLITVFHFADNPFTHNCFYQLLYRSHRTQEDLHYMMASLKATLTEFSPFKNKPPKYDSLQCYDSDASQSLRPIGFTSSARHRACYFTAGLLAAVLFFILSLLAIQIASPSTRTAVEREAEDWNYCGRSSTVAKERGCVMEPLFYGWMPSQCSWKNFSDQWPVFEDRTWYSDKNMTVPILLEDLWAGKNVHIYTNRLASHCNRFSGRLLTAFGQIPWRALPFSMAEATIRC
jgi:hypothetical protein